MARAGGGEGVSWSCFPSAGCGGLPVAVVQDPRQRGAVPTLLAPREELRSCAGGRQRVAGGLAEAQGCLCCPDGGEVCWWTGPWRVGNGRGLLWRLL